MSESADNKQKVTAEGDNEPIMMLEAEAQAEAVRRYEAAAQQGVPYAQYDLAC